jgi:hypothetical protein
MQEPQCGKDRPIRVTNATILKSLPFRTGPSMSDKSSLELHVRDRDRRQQSFEYMGVVKEPDEID